MHSSYSLGQLCYRILRLQTHMQNIEAEKQAYKRLLDSLAPTPLR